jgi:transcriptional regulator with XRE-family HTH domain
MYAISGEKLRQRRESAGLSRAALASRLGVDPSAIAAWERGDYRPKRHRLVALEHALESGSVAEIPSSVGLLDTLTALPAALTELLPATRILRALRLAAPYATPSHIQTDFRRDVGRRLAEGDLEVQRVEIFYTLDRLKEAVWNVLTYDPRRYCLKFYCPGMSEVAPAMGGYFFDDRTFLVGAYWSGIPPHDRPGLRCSGEPFRTFYMSYWREIWGRGTLANPRAGHDLSALKSVALALGLKSDDWPAFVESARLLEIGDGGPPLI